MIRLHVFDDGVDDVVHLHVCDDGVAFFQEFIPQCRDQSRGSFEDRSFQLCNLGFGQVPNGQVGHRSLGRGEDGGRGGFRKNAGSKKSSGGSGVFRVIDREDHTRQLRERLFDDEDGAGGDRRDLPGDASQQESSYVAQPAGSDEDEIGLHPPRLLHDRPGEGAMDQDAVEGGARTGCGLTEGDSSQSLCLAEEDSTGLLRGGQGALLCHGIPASACSEGRRIDHMEKRHILRFPASERFECLYPPP